KRAGRNEACVPFPAQPALFQLAPIRGLRRRGTTIRTWGHDNVEATPCTDTRRNTGLSGVAVARHRGVSAHDRSALRWPREIDPRPRGSDAFGHLHPAGDAEERLG